jgi:hypothetical protein
MAAALIGACIGFLRYNLNPATIFMGDTGSLFLGFVLAALGIKLRFPNNVPWTTWLVPVCVLALPIFDTTLVFVSRLLRGQNPLTTPGKDHLSHRLVALGLTRREAVLTCYLLGGACGMVAIYIAQSRFPNGYAAAGLLLLAGIVAIIWLERHCPAGTPRGQHSGRTSANYTNTLQWTHLACSYPTGWRSAPAPGLGAWRCCVTALHGRLPSSTRGPMHWRIRWPAWAHKPAIGWRCCCAIAPSLWRCCTPRRAWACCSCRSIHAWPHPSWPGSLPMPAPPC